MKRPMITKKQVIAVSVVLAVVQIILFANLINWIKSASTPGKELTELRKNIADARLIIQQEEVIKHNFRLSIAGLDSLAEYAPSRSDRYAWAYEYVACCAAQSQMVLDNLEEVNPYSNDKEQIGDQPYEIRIFTRCSYGNLVEFLWRIEKDNPLLRIKEVTISSAPGIFQTHRIQILIQWLTFAETEKGTS